MKFGLIKLIILFVCFTSLNKSLMAQLSFPKGTELNLNTTNNFLYLETSILFNTGKFSPNDYKWEKISDSLDKRWFVTACFNGDCKNDLLQSGIFLKDFGLNDTTCFIAFHVETYDSTGKSLIKYQVYNIKDYNDKANLTFNISYLNLVGIDEIKNNPISFFPNPATSMITIQSDIDLRNSEIKVFNHLGEIISPISIINSTINIDNLSNGIYMALVKNENKYYNLKFIKK